MTTAHLIEQLEQQLPQTQCGLCSYGGCRPYAEAMATQGERIDRCPPGGEATLRALAQLLHQDPEPLIADFVPTIKPPAVARIKENECIGCTKCIQACPVDAIIGSAKQMHTVLEVECTGCELCVEPCPVDCIDILPLPERQYSTRKAKARFELRQQRLAKEQQRKAQRHAAAKQARQQQAASRQGTVAARKEAIAAAVARVKDKKQQLNANTK